MLQTSGPMITEKDDGSVTAEFTDYNVSEFGGSDYESIYTFDKENADKLRAVLGAKHSGTLQEMFVAEFGAHFDVPAFTKVCADNGIKYSHFTWHD